MTELLLPSPQTTLVILLGASTFPDAPGFEASEAFANSARDLAAYFRDSYHVPGENIANFFDTQDSPSELEKQLGSFLRRRIGVLKQQKMPARDVIIYYVGHGGFTQSNRYHLLIRHTQEPGPQSSKLDMESLANTIKENARTLRRILILDCCFAASAVRYQASPAELMRSESIRVFKEEDQRRGNPTRGTALLCSSSPYNASITFPGAQYTTFSGALLSVLQHGDAHATSFFSLRTLGRLIGDVLYTTYQDRVPLPEVHAPDQSEGDVAAIPFFPNYGLQSDAFTEAETASPILTTTTQSPVATPTTTTTTPPLTRRTMLMLGLAGTGVAVVGMGWLEFPHLFPQPKGTTIASAYHATPGVRSTSTATSNSTAISSPTETGRPGATSDTGQSQIVTVAWSPDGKYIALGSTTQLQVMHITGGEIGTVFFTQPTPDHLLSLAWSHDNSKIALGMQNGKIQIWAVTPKGRLLATTTPTSKSNQQTSLSWSPDNTKILDTNAQIWNAQTGLLVQDEANSFSGISGGTAWTPNAHQIALGSVNKIDIYDLTSNQSVATYNGTSSSDLIVLIAWSPDGNSLAATYINNTLVTVWSAGTDSVRAHFGDSMQGLTENAVAWSPNNTMIASQNTDGSVQIWNALNSKLIKLIPASQQTTCIAWSPDGSYIALGSAIDKGVKIVAAPQ